MPLVTTLETPANDENLIEKPMIFVRSVEVAATDPAPACGIPQPLRQPQIETLDRHLVASAHGVVATNGLFSVEIGSGEIAGSFGSAPVRRR
jgi:hypothetical protein